MDLTVGFNQHLIIGRNWAVATHVTIVLKLFDLDSDIADSYQSHNILDSIWDSTILWFFSELYLGFDFDDSVTVISNALSI